MIAIQTMELTKQYKDKIAVKSLNLSVYKGELFALLGVNGAGKTTTIKMLTCLTKPTSGDAFVLGNSIITSPLKVKAQINVSPQETAIARNLTVRENLELIAGIYGNDKKQSKLKVEETIKSFGLSEIEKVKANTLSGGWQRRLSIAMALITEPQVLFLDEPTIGLDVLARRELWGVIKKLKEDHYYLNYPLSRGGCFLSDRLAVMAGGEIKAIGTSDELIEKTGSDNFEDAFIAIVQEGWSGV